MTGTSFTDTGLVNARTTYYVVRALDAAGNESGPSNEVTALPHLDDRLGEPAVAADADAHDLGRRPDRQRLRPGLDRRRHEPAGRDPEPARPARLRPRRLEPGRQRRVDVDRGVVQHRRGEQRRVRRQPAPEAVGTYDYAYRYSTTDGRDWVYADLDGIGNGYSAAQAGSLTVVTSGDTTAPARPGGLHVLGVAGGRSSSPGTPSPATRRSTATRCAAATRRAGRTRRSRS